jgi:hypothetical protein
MTDPRQALQAMLKAGGSNTSQFPPNSRYRGVATVRLTTADGRTVVYLRRRGMRMLRLTDRIDLGGETVFA